MQVAVVTPSTCSQGGVQSLLFPIHVFFSSSVQLSQAPGTGPERVSGGGGLAPGDIGVKYSSTLTKAMIGLLGVPLYPIPLSTCKYSVHTGILCACVASMSPVHVIQTRVHARLTAMARARLQLHGCSRNEIRQLRALLENRYLGVTWAAWRFCSLA